MSRVQGRVGGEHVIEEYGNEGVSAAEGSEGCGGDYWGKGRLILIGIVGGTRRLIYIRCLDARMLGCGFMVCVRLGVKGEQGV